MALKARGLTFEVEKQEITADITLKRGEIRGLYGESGTGKSNLFSLLSGQKTMLFKSGSITYDEHVIIGKTPDDRVKLVSLMFQNPDMQFCMGTAEEELLFCLENKQTLPNEMAKKVNDALTFCDIDYLRNRPLAVLSGGEKQLVALACCIALESPYLLLDEPFANLDRATTMDIVEKLKKLQKERHIGILLIDHQLKNGSGWINEWYHLKNGTLTLTSYDQLKKQELTFMSGLPLIESKSSNNQPDRLVIRNFELSMPEHTLVLPDLNLKPGQIIGITGKSGLGKSTLLKALAGTATFNGTVQLDSMPIKKGQKKIFNKLSWVMQNPQDQFIAPTVYLELNHKNQPQHQALETLQQLNLVDKKDTSPYLLSQGQQRRLAVSSYLDRKVDLLLVDEPTYGQDKANALMVMNLLQQKANTGTLILVVSHDVELLKTYCSDTWNLNLLIREKSNETVESNDKIFRNIGNRISRFFSK